MKKLISLLMALLLTVALAAPAMAEGYNIIDIKPTMLGVLDMSADEWYSSNESRVMLATVTLMDVVLTENERATDIASGAVVNDTVYVGRHSTNGTVITHFWSDQYCLVVIFAPAEGFLSAAIQDAGTTVNAAMISYVMDGMIENGNLGSYYQVSGDDILGMYQAILSAISE